MTDAFTKEQQDVLTKVEKLMRLAGANPNEAEAESATAKAMELLAAYNLDLSAVEANADGSGKRADEKLQGGFYEYERDLWGRVADLNFCFYWSQFAWVWRSKKAELEYKAERMSWNKEAQEKGIDSIKPPRWKSKYSKQVRQHRLVGRVVNIAATKAMMGYLSGAIERLVRERLREREGSDNINSQLLSRWAVSYREGVAHTIETKLWDRREAMYAADQKAAEEHRRREAEAGMKGASTATGLTLFTLRQSERDANADFLYGEGYSAKQAAARADRARKTAEAEAEYTRWAQANPEEAAKKAQEQQAEQRKADARRARRGGGGGGKERDWGAFRAGREAGEAIGLDPQAEGSKVSGVLK